MLTDVAQYFATSPYISGLMMILLNVGTSFLMQDIMPIAKRFFQYKWMRRLVFFAVFFTATRNFIISVILTVSATLVLDLFLNETSRFCLIPYESRQTQQPPPNQNPNPIPNPNSNPSPNPSSNPRPSDPGNGSVDVSTTQAREHFRATTTPAALSRHQRFQRNAQIVML
jgi:hypothetical protein